MELLASFGIAELSEAPNEGTGAAGLLACMQSIILRRAKTSLSANKLQRLDAFRYAVDFS